MRRIKNLLQLVAILICIFIGWWTAQDNTEIVPVYLLGFHLPPLSVGVWLMVMLAAGAVLGMLASLPVLFRTRAEIRRLKRSQQG